VFAGTVGLAALLLFQVQLVLGKRLLPWYGGASAAWTTCLLFFQAALLAGYAWAHALAGLPPRRQRAAYLALVGAAVALLAWRALAWPSPVTPGSAPGREAVDAPILSILGLLASTIGLPFVALAATSPLLQSWHARLRPGSSPFWLFALSNAGSLLGLAAYPLVVEPLASLRTQGWLWSAGFVAFAAGVAWCAYAKPATTGEAAVSTAQKRSTKPDRESTPVGAPAGVGGTGGPSETRTRAFRGVTLGVTLAFFPSVMLAAVTSHLTQEVGAVPFLWMLPLAIYLLTFIVAFAWPDAGRTASRAGLAVAAVLALVGLHFALSLGVAARLLLWSAVLFAYGMAGHGELARRRPDPSRLTGYYLGIAAGGALGGFLCAVVAPLVFKGYWELHLGILAGPATLLAAGLADTEQQPLAVTRQLRVALALAVVVLGAGLGAEIVADGRGVERASRGFYGVLRVVREEPGLPDECLRLLNGRISHGVQLVAPSRRAELTTYFGPPSGVGLAIGRHPKRLAGRPMRIGVIGLGAGTLAAWSRPGDVVRFYELDPGVVRLSAGEAPVFTFLRDAEGDVSVALGDGRLTLEREAPQEYDVLAVDAFSSDSIPMHLLTVEAFRAYLRHLARDGVLAFHVTNRYLDLKPVVRGAAAALALEAEHVPSPDQGMVWAADWMLVARGRAFFEDEVVSAASLPRLPRSGQVLWTDDWSNLLRVVKR
jgi:hypothetical protein